MKNFLFACAGLALSGCAALAATGPYPNFAGSPALGVTGGGVLPRLNGQGEPLSANSLPAGFEQGTAPYRAAQEAARYFQDLASPAHPSMAER